MGVDAFSEYIGAKECKLEASYMTSSDPLKEGKNYNVRVYKISYGNDRRVFVACGLHCLDVNDPAGFRAKRHASIVKIYGAGKSAVDALREAESRWDRTRLETVYLSRIMRGGEMHNRNIKEIEDYNPFRQALGQWEIERGPGVK